MIYLGDLRQISTDKYSVGFVHYMPFDLNNGLKNEDGTLKTEAQLRESGALVESIPQAEPPEGKVTAGMFYNPFTGTVFYEYEDRPKSKEEIMQGQIDTLALSVLDLMGV